MNEEHSLNKKNPDTDFDATCVFCGGTKRIQLWPHRDGAERMVGFVFVCNACKEYADGCKLTFAPKEASHEL
jgi:hypothetical protein